MYIMPNIMYAAIKAFDIYIYWHFIGDWGESQWIENINKDRWEDWIEFLKIKGRYNTMDLMQAIFQRPLRFLLCIHKKQKNLFYR